MVKPKNTKSAALDPLFRAVCEYLTTLIETGEASHNDVRNAIQFLKDNGITALLSETNDDAPMNQLMKAAEDSGIIQFPFPVSPNLLPEDDPIVKESAGA